ncbi:MAG TPA: T9SS type A sorting domain-containing protein [Bacteroidia bacterium]|nr:T9SS type A sorting domain-containing protein [Bacteroidia bacterium]
MKNKKLFNITLFLFAFCCCKNLHGQILLDKHRIIGGSDKDDNPLVLAYSNNSYLLFWDSKSNDGDITGNHGGKDIVVTMLDSNLNTIWQRCYGGSLDESVKNVYKLVSGNILILGTSNSADGDISNNIGFWDIWALKIDSAGNIVKERCYGGTTVEILNYGCLMNDSDVILSSKVGVHDYDIIPGFPNDRLWKFKIDTALGDIKKSVVEYTEPAYFEQWLVGFDSTTISDRSLSIYDYYSPIRALSTTYDINLNILSHNSHYTNSLSYIPNYMKSPSGIYFEFVHNFFYVGNYPNGQYWSDMDAIVYSNPNWYRTYSGAKNDIILDGVFNDSNQLFFIGNTQSIDGDFANPNHCQDNFVMRADSLGNIQNISRISDLNNCDQLSYKIYKLNSKYVITCSTNKKKGNNWSKDILIAQFDEKINKLSGQIFIDQNGNNVLDLNEQKINQPILHINPSSERPQINDGNYTYYTATSGIYNLTIDSIKYYVQAPANQTAIFLSDSGEIKNKDFAFQPSGIYNDLEVSITKINSSDTSKVAIFNINASNIGTSVIDSKLSFEYDFIYNVNTIKTSITPDSIIGNTLYWALDSLLPLTSMNILVSFSISDSAITGDSLTVNLKGSITSQDFDTVNNVSSEVFHLEPYGNGNEMIVNIDTIITNQNYDYPELEYSICFQNSNYDINKNVYIKNDLQPEYFDMSTFKFVESSHPVKILVDEPTGKIWFEFNNLNLSPVYMNELLSHGFIKYRIKIKDSTSLGTILINEAEVSFDQNLKQPLVSEVHILPICSSSPDSIYSSSGSHKLCDNDQIYLSVSGGALSKDGNFCWYKDSCSGTPIAKGETYYTGHITQSTMYYVRAEDSCGIGSCISFYVTVSPYYPILFGTPNGVSACNDSLLIYGHALASGTTNWYNSGSLITSDIDSFYAKISGYYTFEFTSDSGCKSVKSTSIDIHKIKVSLTSDSIICNGTKIKPTKYFSHYSWSDGSQNPYLEIDTPGTYTVTVSDNYGCSASSSTTVGTVIPSPVLELNGNCDTTVCNSILLDAQNPGSSYLWNNGATTQTYLATNSGLYSVIVTALNGCTKSDSIQVDISSFPPNMLGNDTTVCGTTFSLTPSFWGPSFLWSTGQTTQSISIDTSGTYSVTVTDYVGCTGMDEINLIISPKPQVFFVPFVSNTICKQGGLININQGTPTGGKYYLNHMLYQNSVIDPTTLPLYVNLIAYKYVDSVGCSDSVLTTFWISPCASINSMDSESSISIIPNPASDYFTVHTSISNYCVKLFSAKGELVFEKSNCKNDTRVITKMYDAGLYTIQLIAERGTIALKVSVVKN